VTSTHPAPHPVPSQPQPTPSPEAASASISDHATSADAQLRRGFGPRVRKLHARIGKAHHQAEGMAFSKALLAGQATPLQLAALLRALVPAYRLIEEQAPAAAAQLGASDLPWRSLARSAALEHDVATLQALPATPTSAAAAVWLEQLRVLARQAPHRLMAHVYVRYGGDLSGGQQLAQQAGAILERNGLPRPSFWLFERPITELKAALHDGFEHLQLSDSEEQELLQEAEAAFHATQALLAELGELA
jgi:heme oxygenase (biliverdin-producing, ferredoxin)